MDIRKDGRNKYVIIFVIIVILCLLTMQIPLVVAEKEAVANYESALKEAEEKVLIAEENLNSIEVEVTDLGDGGVRALDLSQPCGFTAEELGEYLQGGLIGLEETFIKAEEEYGVNAVFLVSIAAIESAWGTINFLTNNMFGYGSSSYATKEDCIYDVAEGLGNNYLKESGSLYNGPTIDGVHVYYASSSLWDDKVASQMEILYAKLYVSAQENVDEELKTAEEELELALEELETVEKAEEEREKLWYMKN